MRRSSRYHLSAAGELPGTLRRSPEDAQEAFRRAREDAVRAYGEGDQADRAAYAALKENFEKCGDHWIARGQRANWPEAAGRAARDLQRPGPAACATAAGPGSLSGSMADLPVQ